jgi:hypothetical protein
VSVESGQRGHFESPREDFAVTLMAESLFDFSSWLYELNLRALYKGKCDGGIGDGNRRGTNR